MVFKIEDGKIIKDFETLKTRIAEIRESMFDFDASKATSKMQKTALLDLDADIQALNNYHNALQTEGVAPTKAFEGTMGKASQSAKDFASTVQKDGVQAIQQYNTAQRATISGMKAVTIGSKVAATSLKALNVAMNIAFTMGIGIIIQGIVTAIDEMVVTSKEARDAALELSNATKDQISSLQSLQKEYLNIVESTASDSEKNKDLVEWKKKLVEQYGFEKDALDKVNLSRQTGIDLLDKEIGKQIDKWYAGSYEEYKKAQDIIEGGATASVWAGAKSFDGKEYRHQMVLTQEDVDSLSKSLDGLGLSFENVGKFNENGDRINIGFETNDLVEQYAKLEKVVGSLNKKKELAEDGFGTFSPQESDLLVSLQKDYNDLGKAIEDYKLTYDTGNQMVAKNILLQNASKLNEIVDKTSFERVRQEIIDLAGDNVKLQGILGNSIDGMAEFQKYTDNIQTVNQAPKISTTDTIDSLSTLQEKFSSISSAAKDFADTGKVTMASLGGMSKEFGDLEGYDNLVRVLSGVSPAAEDVERALSSMIGEYIAGNDAIKNIDDSTRALVQSTLEEMGVLNAEEIATSALAQAQNNLAAQKFLAANPDLLNTCMLESNAFAILMGMSDGTKQAIFNLAMQKALLADSSLSGMTAEGVQSLLNLATAAGITGGAIDQLRAKISAQQAVDRGAWNPGVDRILNAPVTLPPTPSVNIPTPKMDWGSFSSNAGGAAKSQKDVNEALTEFLALLEHRKSMDEFVENEDEYVKALIYAYQNLTKTEEERRDLAEKIYSAKKSQLENEKSALEGAAQAAMRKYDDEIDGINEVIDELDEKIKLHEKEKSNLESAHNAVIRLLDKEIEKLRTKYDEEKKQIEDKKSKYEQAHSAVMDAIDAEIKKYEDQKTAIDDLYQPQIDAVQEQIDLLQKKNDETKKEIELEKSKAALASANSQKVNQVYKEGIGFVYEADGDAILDAQQRLDELAHEKEISDLEDKKTGLETERDDKKGSIDEQIEALQKYKDKWDEILSSFEKQQNIDVANSIFGPNWSADVLNGNLDIMNSFKDGYLEIQQQITDITAEQEAANKRAEILEQYKEQWQDELDSYKNAEEERLANVTFYAGWEQDILSGRQEAFNIFRDEYLDVQDKITDDTKKREAFEADVKRLEQYKEQWQDELDSYQRFEDNKKAIELWGADWESKILNNREEALDEFKVAYGNVQDQIAEISRDSLTPNYNLEKSIGALADANDRYVQSIYNRIAAEEEARAAKKNGYSGEGYASGTSHGKQGWHRVDEFGTEAKMGKMNGNYAFIKDGDVVFNRSQTEFLYNFSQMHQPAMLNRMAEDYIKMTEPMRNIINVPVTPNITTVTQRFDNITLPNVKDFQDFLTEIGRIGLDARQVNFRQ